MDRDSLAAKRKAEQGIFHQSVMPEGHTCPTKRRSNPDLRLFMTIKYELNFNRLTRLAILAHN
jgi:hypothetical protein